MIKNISKGILLLTFFFMNISVALSVDIGDFSALQGAIEGQQTPLNITSPTINWPANSPLTINYNPTFMSSLREIVFDGQNQSRLFAASQLTTWGNGGGSRFIFQNGRAPASSFGGAMGPRFTRATFNDPVTFDNNSSAQGGALITNTGGEITFNKSASFSRNSAQFGGAIIIRGSTLTFNDTATFINNTASSNGGAIQMESSSSVIIRTTNPEAPTVFQGNKPNAFNIKSKSQLTLDTDAGTLIDIQDGIVSSEANSQTTITKQGPGTWRQASDSTGYKGTTNVMGGTFELQPGAVYGTMDSGAFSLDPGANLAFNFGAVGNVAFPLLQAANVTLNGITSTGSKFKAGERTVILSGTPILVNGASFSRGDLLTNGQTLFYDWRFLFNSPNEVILSSIQTHPIKGIVDESEGDKNDEGVAETLDAFDVDAHPESLLADYIFEIKNSSTPQEVRERVDPLQGGILTGGYDLLWNQMTNFAIQVDDHLTPSPCTAMKDKESFKRVSVDTHRPLICDRPSPWVAWGQILGGRGYQSSYRGNNGYDSVNGGLIAGADRFLDPNWRLGAAVTYQRGTLDWAKYNSETRGNTVGGIVYGAYSRNAWFAQSQVGGGGSRLKNQRNIPLSAIYHPTVTASSGITLPFFLGRAEGGYHFDYKGFRLTPSLGLLYLYSQNSAYAEGGAGDFNLSVNGAHRNNLEAQGFFEVAYNALINERPVIFRVNYGLGYGALDKQTTLTTGFLTFPELPTFTAKSLNMGRWRQIAEVGINVEVAKNVRLRFDYLGLFTPHQYNQTGAVGLKALF